MRDSFSESFSIARNLSCWRKCGAVPLTMAPLFSGEIQQEVPVGAASASDMHEEDDGIAKLKSLEDLNQFYCTVLNSSGFDGKLLRSDAPTKDTYVAVTEPNSKERVQAIKKAKGAGQMFFATGGRHLNSNEFFEAKALTEREARTKELEARKRLLTDGQGLEQDVNALLIYGKGQPYSQKCKKLYRRGA
jgi:hypothetical protein